MTKLERSMVKEAQRALRWIHEIGKGPLSNADRSEMLDLAAKACAFIKLAMNCDSNMGVEAAAILQSLEPRLARDIGDVTRLPSERVLRLVWPARSNVRS